MGKNIQFNKNNMVVFLFNKKVREWEDKTLSIGTIYWEKRKNNTGYYTIYFKGTHQHYSYQSENVKILHKVEDISIDKYSVYIDGNITNALKIERFEHGFYRVHKAGGSCLAKNIKLVNNVIFKYYCDLADYAGQIFEETSPLYFLSKNYTRISPLAKSVLIDYFQGKLQSVNDDESIIVPFDFNQSQVQAIARALTHNVSIIEGPPGTGKTQTILNLIANIIYRNKNCAVISNNNTAINNIYEKMLDEGYSFCLATLGSKTNVEQFFESDQNQPLSHFLEQEPMSLDRRYKSRINELNEMIKKIQDAEVALSRYEAQMRDIKNEKRHYDNFSDTAIIIDTKLPAHDYMSLIARLEMPKKMFFWERWRLGWKFKVKIAKHDVDILLHNAEKLYYQSKIHELTLHIESKKKFLLHHNKEEAMDELQYVSRALFEKTIRQHYTEQNDTAFNMQSYKNYYLTFIHRYPVVLSTSYSLLNNIPSGFLFDYLIIDEASQGDLLSSVLAMSCAKKLVVVGDSRQLQRIDEEKLCSCSEHLSKKYNIPQAYRYDSHSVLNSVSLVFPHIPTTLLQEHYRCAPDIINFCNKMFYNGQLVAMTENTGKHIEIIKTVAGNHARKNPHGSGLYNQREIDELAHVLQESQSESIGVISPFRHQANLITQQYGTERIESDTIHKFQGRQKEEVILSFVVNSLEKNPENVENRLYNFVTNEQLMNVAISRGRNKVTVIVSDKVYHNSENNSISDFIKYAEYLYGSHTTKESSVTSVFDWLYSEYTDALLSQYKKKPEAHKTELLMCDLINDVLQNYSRLGYSMHTRLSKLVVVPQSYSEEERGYILHPWTHVDFLFYNKVSKRRLFVLEIDGITYHEQNKKQVQRDDIKNRILELNNIPIFRFKTNESNERQRLINIITEIGF